MSINLQDSVPQIQTEGFSETNETSFQQFPGPRYIHSDQNIQLQYV